MLFIFHISSCFRSRHLCEIVDRKMSNPIRLNPQRPSPNSSTISKPPSLKNLSEKFSTAVSIHSSKSSLDSEAPKNASEFNWQEKKTTLKARFSHLFNNETLADVHFIVGTEELRIPAHKLGQRKFHSPLFSIPF